jgi:hypothetical protein
MSSSENSPREVLPNSILLCKLTYFEPRLEEAFSRGLTPLLIDTSPGDSICTYFSYQPDYTILDAKAMIFASQSAGLDIARKALVNAMRYGKTLVVRLGQSAPDFVNKYCDEKLVANGVVPTTSLPGSAFFPLCVFEMAGKLLHDADVHNQRGIGSGTNASSDSESCKLLLPSGKSTEETATSGGVADTDKKSSSSDPSPTTGTGTGSGGTSVRAPNAPTINYSDKLYRSEDMRPHLNFAMCRREFRVCVTSQLPLSEVEALLFGTGSCLPDRRFFQLIHVENDDEEEDGDGDENR